MIDNQVNLKRDGKREQLYIFSYKNWNSVPETVWQLMFQYGTINTNQPVSVKVELNSCLPLFDSLANKQQVLARFGHLFEKFPLTLEKVEYDPTSQIIGFSSAVTQATQITAKCLQYFSSESEVLHLV